MITHPLPSLRIASHRFTRDDLRAGHVVLDFVNTAAGLNRDPRDWLDSYTRLIDWAELADICDAGLSRELLTLDRTDPVIGQDALVRVRLLRSALYELLHSIRDGIRPPDSAVKELQRWCRRGGAAMELGWAPDGMLRTSFESCRLDVIGVTIAWAAAELLSRTLDQKLGVCAGHNCGWIFLDTSKSRRRRWCDMKTCGNAAKANRHYQRKLLSAGM
jgi:predicted RNA-binding Zn ribbon-like protein